MSSAEKKIQELEEIMSSEEFAEMENSDDIMEEYEKLPNNDDLKC